MASDQDRRNEPLTAVQCKAGRALLGWSQADLARKANVAVSTVADFERLSRKPVPNNLQALGAAFESAGISFALGGAVVGPPPIFRTATDVPTRELRPVRWIDETVLNSWAALISTREEFPELLRRLLLARFGYGAAFRFPSGSAIQLRGWDAVTDVESDDALVPSGPAGWELGVNENIRAKAESDFWNRVRSEEPLALSRMIFVFVTPRYWGGKDEWRQEKLIEGIFRDVRVLDGVDLAQLLEQTPGVALWLAQRIGRVPSGVHLLTDAWKEWASSTAQPLTEDLILTGRDDTSTAIHKWLNGPPASIAVQAESTSEAIAFLYASLSEYPPDAFEAFLSRALVVTTAETAREIANVPVPLVVVLSEIDPSVANLLLGKGHHVFLAYGSGIAAPTNVLALPRIGRHALAIQLKSVLPERHERKAADNLERLARDAGGSLTVLRRLMEAAPGLMPPAWARSDQARSYLPLLLAGAWDDESEKDREVLESLAGLPYRDVQVIQTKGLALAESPVRRVGKTWKIASPRDAWFRLAKFLIPSDVDTFERVVLDVLGARDPDPDRDDDWFARPQRAPTYSHSLRQGLVETLILFGVFGDIETSAVGNLGARAAGIVNALLLDADEKRWLSLADYLQELAEASPEQFLASVERSLESNERAILTLFKVDGDGFFGTRHHYTDLLWALELLAWSPDYLPQVTRILLQLSQLDPKADNLVNRPANSLRHIYLPWLPQTFATLAERLEILSSMRAEFPAEMWRLTLDLYPKGHDTASYNPTPRWRSFERAGGAEITTNRSIWHAERALAAWIAKDIGASTERWVEIIGRLTHFSPDLRTKLASQLLAASKKFKARDRIAVRDALRKELSRNRRFVNAGWALPEEELAAFEKAYNALEERDPFARIAWLFKEYSPPLLNPPTNFRAAEVATRKARADSLTDLGKTKGWTIVRDFANSDASIKRGLVGVALADAAGADVLDGMWSFLLRQGDATGRDIAAGAIDTVRRGGPTGLTARLLDAAMEEAWPSESIATVMICLPQNAELYARLEECDPAVQAYFWKGVWPRDLDLAAKGLTWVIRNLIAHDRAYDAAELLHDHLTQAGSALIIEVLRGLLDAQDKEARSGNDPVMLQYYVEHIFLQLDRDPALDLAELARLEWQFLNVLEDSSRPPRMLLRRLATSPEFFVEILSLVYRAADEEPVEEPDPKKRANIQKMANHAHTLLRTWHHLPGQDGDRVEAKELDAWVDQARGLCAAVGRGDVADEKIGELFAHAPSDPDGAWPCLAVRSVIERIKSERVNVGIYIGTRNKRGVTARGVFDGGELERREVDYYRGLAKRFRLKWPRTAATLERIASSYEDEARDFDEEAARRDW